MSEIRAARERLRSQHPKDKFMMTNYVKKAADLFTLAYHDLAAHPPDDDESVTEDRLLSAGFVDRAVGEFVNGQLLVFQDGLSLWRFSVGAGTVLMLPNQSWGDVRLLCRALGIPLESEVSK